jgi:tRNA-Thr(GGU) m(6)t(6)A37 methyltransferase TsaA
MIEVNPIGFVHAARREPTDDHWGGTEARIELAPAIDASALDGIETFSHVEILFHFLKVDAQRVEMASRHPRENPAWPKVGIFAQRGKGRPNRLGTCVVRLVSREPRALVVAELDAIDGTPVLDIKPLFVELLPREPVHQPPWSHELMRDYWSPATGSTT